MMGYIYDGNKQEEKKIYSPKEGNSLDELNWSPSGEWIAFKEGDYYSGMGLYIIPIDGGEKHRLLPQNVSYLSWSPKGDKIAYTTVGSPGRNELFLLTVLDRFR